VTVGDVNSTEVGSGARFNDGKLDYSLVLFKFLPLKDWSPEKFFAFMHEYQLSGNSAHLNHARTEWMNFCISLYGSNYLDEVVRVWEFGKEKYAAFNWTKGMAWSVPIGCIGRHYTLMLDDPYAKDSETGLPHWAHIECNLQMLLHYSDHYKKGNDLPVQVV